MAHRQIIDALELLVGKRLKLMAAGRFATGVVTDASRSPNSDHVSEAARELYAMIMNEPHSRNSQRLLNELDLTITTIDGSFVVFRQSEIYLLQEMLTRHPDDLEFARNLRVRVVTVSEDASGRHRYFLDRNLHEEITLRLTRNEFLKRLNSALTSTPERRSQIGEEIDDATEYINTILDIIGPPPEPSGAESEVPLLPVTAR